MSLTTLEGSGHKQKKIPLSCFNALVFTMRRGQKRAKTYNSGDSLVVTHLTTNPPVHCLYMAERTGSLILSVLWSYVEEEVHDWQYIGDCAEAMKRNEIGR